MMTRFAPHAAAPRFKTLNFPAPLPANPAASAAPKPPKRQRLAPFQHARLRAKIASVTCSDPWTELATAAAVIQGIHPDAQSVPSQLALRGIYPPKPDLGPNRLPRIGAVRMRRCHTCGRIVPPNNLASYKLLRLCDDCRIQPEPDPDETAKLAAFERLPGKRRRPLVEGSVIDDDITPARRQLLRIGLTDSQITALALINEGYPHRAIAELCGWNASYIHKLLRTAETKLRASGLVLPALGGFANPNRANRIDPKALDAISDRVI